ncbi:hypothetical protein BaRGS_00002051 [Batillaria attramentaria]|uniref:Uncharacterized protein n=1 Tax=Batillaria attramentaria TaxID=370345 RepID=A0ABD0M462_9CAEN
MDSYGRILRVTPDPSTRTIPAIYNPNYHAYHTFNNHSLFNTPIHHGGSSWPDSSHCPEPTSGDMASCPPSYDSVMCSVDMGFTNSGGCSGDTGGFSGGDSGGCSAGDSGGGCSGDSGGGCSGD